MRTVGLLAAAAAILAAVAVGWWLDAALDRALRSWR